MTGHVFCTNCGAQIEAEARFCAECGEEQNATNAAPQTVHGASSLPASEPSVDDRATQRSHATQSARRSLVVMLGVGVLVVLGLGASEIFDRESHSPAQAPGSQVQLPSAQSRQESTERTKEALDELQAASDASVAQPGTTATEDAIAVAEGYFAAVARRDSTAACGYLVSDVAYSCLSPGHIIPSGSDFSDDVRGGEVPQLLGAAAHNEEASASYMLGSSGLGIEVNLEQYEDGWKIHDFGFP